MTHKSPRAQSPKWRDTTNATWVRPPQAKETDATIVEVAKLEDGIYAVRDGKAPEKGILYFTTEEWHAFQQGAKEGEFDVPH